MSIEKNNLDKLKIDKKILLEELAGDIARNFGIEREKAKDLIKEETLSGIDYLKNELSNQDKKLNNKELEKLFFSLKGALEIIKNSSKVEIQTLKDDIEKSISIEEFKNKIEDYLPPKLIWIAKNPTKPHEHVLGFALGSANSIFTTIEVLYKIGKGIVQAPYHLYMIVIGKAETNSFKDI